MCNLHIIRSLDIIMIHIFLIRVHHYKLFDKNKKKMKNKKHYLLRFLFFKSIVICDLNIISPTKYPEKNRPLSFK